MTLKRLAEYNRYVWIVCSTDDLAAQFLKKAAKEGFTTPDGGTPADLTPYPMYGISGDMCVGYVSRTVAGLVKKHGIHITPQIDFEKFLKGRRSCILLNPYNEFEDFHKWNALVEYFYNYKYSSCNLQKYITTAILPFTLSPTTEQTPSYPCCCSPGFRRRRGSWGSWSL